MDRPAHVRSASSLAWFGGKIAAVQDDANFIALIDPNTNQVDALTLPPGEAGLRQFDDGRGNKAFKLDLEACFSVPKPQGEILVAMGSGSSPRRETVLFIDGTGAVRSFHAKDLYHRLRTEKAFSGSELNIESAACADGWLRLFNRGNGRSQNPEPSRNAACAIAWAAFEAHLHDNAPVPQLHAIVEYDLGALDGTPLSFTDVALAGPGRLLFTAAAEASPDAVTDGAVSGSALGVIDPAGGCRWIELRTADGRLVAEKLEGICPAAHRPDRAYAIIDADNPARPSVFCEVALGGPWFDA